MLVVPSVSGAQVLRRRGKRTLVTEWQALLAAQIPPAPLSLQWRLLEALPQPASTLESRCTQPVRTPGVSDLELSGGNSLRCRVRVPYDLAIFNGHFPTIPIVPAVVQVGWALDLARSHLQVDGEFRGITAAKFRRLVQPGMGLVLVLEHQPENGSVRFDYSRADAQVSTGRVLLGSADD
jgi:3-hydroxymyristoyl/3-hydroxydecanoyl-(acyl carrier protein) dehydratase